MKGEFGTGRPATGRNKAVSVKISQEAYEILQGKKNKSEYIDRLIRAAEFSKLIQ